MDHQNQSNNNGEDDKRYHQKMVIDSSLIDSMLTFAKTTDESCSVGQQGLSCLV